jgi:hypothetical protein
MKFASLIFMFTILSSAAFANESGFVYQGKKYVVFKDGEKVGPTYEEKFKEKSRVPAAKMSATYNSFISYEDDEIARCYRYGSSSGGADTLFCVKK